MNKFFGHLKTILVHKWWVFYYCCKLGIPWRGLTHDLSKFSPTEFFESVKYYTGTKSPIDTCKQINGVSKAWMHHKGRNRHHYEYWQDNFDKGGNPVLMPFNESLEMICDYLGAGRAYMKKDFSYRAEWEWWKNKCKNPLAMHPVNKAFVGQVLRRLKDGESLRRVRLEVIYDHLINPVGAQGSPQRCRCVGTIHGFGQTNRLGRTYSKEILDMIVTTYSEESTQVPVYYYGSTSGKSFESVTQGTLIGSAHSFKKSSDTSVTFEMSLQYPLDNFTPYDRVSLQGDGAIENGNIIDYEFKSISMSDFCSMDSSVVEIRD